MITFKKIAKASVVSLSLFGLVLVSTPAQAGFFDWFDKTPLSQEAASYRAVQKVDASLAATPTQAKNSKASGFFSKLFGVKEPVKSPVENLGPQQCGTESQIGQVVALMSELGVPLLSILAVEDVLLGGSTTVVITQNSGLTQAEVASILAILQSFGCNNSTIYMVNDLLTYQPQPAVDDCELEFQNVTIPNQTLVNNANLEFYRFKFKNIGDNDCKVSKLQFNVPHQLSSNGVVGQSRLYILNSSTPLSTAPASSGQYMQFSDVGVIIPPGVQKTFSVRGGISGASSPAHYLTTWLFNAEVYDTETNYGVNVSIPIETTTLTHSS